jgi:phosphatidylserine decarboxylase
MIAKQGLPYILVPVFVATLLLVLWLLSGLGPLAGVAVGLVLVALFMTYFFRDPQRHVPSEPNIIVSPADGRVTFAGPAVAGDENSPWKVSIFLSPLNVHINRAPISCRVADIVYTKGKFLMATNPEASVVNEQNALTLAGTTCTLVCTQIAGILARRIVCWKRKGDQLEIGERFGLIKFSSRTDLILPRTVVLAVAVGARVKGGESIIARIT